VKKRSKGATDLEYVALHLESLTELLIERGVITRQDLDRAMKVTDLDDDSIDGGLHIDVMRRAMKGKTGK
jgi:hypothetical protein